MIFLDERSFSPPRTQEPVESTEELSKPGEQEGKESRPRTSKGGRASERRAKSRASYNFSFEGSEGAHSRHEENRPKQTMHPFAQPQKLPHRPLQPYKSDKRRRQKSTESPSAETNPAQSVQLERELVAGLRPLERPNPITEHRDRKSKSECKY